MSSSGSILVERHGPVALLIINRPQVKNAMDLGAMDALQDAVTELGKDPDLRSVIFTGAGSDAFCAGGDLKQFQALDDYDKGLRMSLKMQAALTALANLPVPVLGVLNGYAMGGGCEAFLASDIRIAEAHSRMWWKQLSMGVTTGWGGAGRLFCDVGERRALRMLLLQEDLDAVAAQTAGLVDQVVESGTGRTVAMQLAARIVDTAPVAVRMLKRSLKLLTTENHAQMQAECFATSWASADHHEAVDAFFGKRAPRWTGR